MIAHRAKMKYMDWLAQWLENYVRPSVKARTYEHYKRIAERRVECFTLDEQKKIESAVSESKKDKLYGILLCLYSGLRIGELIALRWSDIDFSKGVLTCPAPGGTGGAACSSTSRRRPPPAAPSRCRGSCCPC